MFLLGFTSSFLVLLFNFLAYCMRRMDLLMKSLKKIEQTLLVHINQVKKVRYPFWEK